MRGLCIVAVAALLLAGCGDREGGDEDRQLSVADLGETQEARSFMDGGNAVWTEDIPTNELRELIDQLYAAGAQQVMFADIMELDGARISAWLVVRMPVFGGDRSRVLAAFNTVYAEYYGEAETDRGQAYLELTLD